MEVRRKVARNILRKVNGNKYLRSMWHWFSNLNPYDKKQTLEDSLNITKKKRVKRIAKKVTE